MDIIIQSLGFTADEDLERFIREKLEKFNNDSSIIRANVTMFIGSDGNPNRYCCEIRLEIPGNDIFVKKNADNFEKATVAAVDALQRTTRKAKEKLIQRHQTGPTQKV